MIMSDFAYERMGRRNSFQPPVFVTGILAAVDTLAVCLATAPWLFQDIHSPRVLLAPIVNGPLIALLFVGEILLWNYVRSRLLRWETESDAAFAKASPSRPEVAISQAMRELAVLLIRREPGRLAWLAESVVYVDDQAVRSMQLDATAAVLVQPGRHKVFIKSGWFKSDEVNVDLAAGEQVDLGFGCRPPVKSRFFRFFELKMVLVAMPVALAAFCLPGVMRVVERHFAVELLAIVFLGQLGFLVGASRCFSRRPGAMIYLTER
jgi:hypothetical protein